MLRRIIPGGTIGVMAPAYAPDPQKLQRGLNYLEDRGFRIIRGRSLDARHGHFAGDDLLRLDDLHALYSNPQVDGIICARGGWGCLRYLDKIDFDLIRHNPKVLVGYSDITTLQLALFRRTGLPSLSGPMAAVEMGTGITAFTETHFWKQIFNEESRYTVRLSDTTAEVMNHGEAEGILLGGCLSLITTQLGTDFSPDFIDAILFIEDVGESSYRIDRHLAHLKQAGILARIRGVILGEFLDCDPEPDDHDSFKVLDILREYFGSRSIPVIYNFPYGHGMNKISMPVGMRTRLETETGLLTFSNPFFAP